MIQPYPPYAQAVAPEINPQGMQLLKEQVQKLLGSSAPRVGHPEALPAPTPAKDGAAAPSQSQDTLPRTTIEAEGDDQLSINIHDEDIRKVLELLSAQGDLNILSGKNVTGKVSARLTDVDIETALDAILKSTGYVARRDGNLIFVGAPGDFDAMEQAMDRIGTRVYRPNYISAAEMQTLIQPLLTAELGVVSVSTPATAGIGSDAEQAGGDTFAGADVVVVRDYEAVLAEVDQMVDEVDVRPLQVHIEAMILSVKLKDTDQYGVSFELLRDKPNVNFGWGAPVQTLADFKFEEGALKVGFLDSSLGSFLSALESIGDTNVIATPRLMVINKQRAEIQIGEKKGYVSTTVTETTSTESVEFLDIGAQLRLRPFISSDGLIRMEIHPELSDGTVEVKGGFTLPNKEITQVTTNIMVRDGCTVVIGGLMRENLSTTTNQVPVLGNLPLVGFCFRSSSETTERREVLVLITPQIVYEPETCEQGDQEAGEFFRRQSLYFDKMTPLNKRHIGRRYFRMAQTAWARGDRDRALRFAELSVHFDPLNRAAIDLRSDIWLGNPIGNHTLGSDLMMETSSLPMDGVTIAPWLLEELQQQPVPPSAPLHPLHPLDPGQPGNRVDVVRPRRLE